MQVLWSLACVCVTVSVVCAEYYELSNAAQYFEDFMIKYDKHYANEHEKAGRFEIFKANLDHINRLNKESNHAVFAIRRFADLTPKEFKAMHTGLRVSEDDDLCKLLVDEDIHGTDAPESFDWRDSNVVTRVKDQGLCGSCYAFSATGQLEGQQAIKHKKLLELSEQELINCDTEALGCFGGLPSNALKTAIKVGGMMLEKDCVYQLKKMACKVDPSKIVVNVTDCTSYNLTSQEKVKQLLYNVGPISIVIKGAGVQHHGAGIISDEHCNQGDLSHAVLLVGYGTENGMPYWTFKNSWGPNEGEKGYFRMQRGDNKNGACGMLNQYMASAEVA